MKPLQQSVAALATVGLILTVVEQGWCDARPNPYLSIVDRNPFGLKDPPPPPPPTPVVPVVPPAKVILTGITSLFGPTSKRALIEITDQEPGKPASIRKPILREGERDGSVEVVSIDLEKSMVHIRNSGQELDLKFDDPSKSPSTAAHPVAMSTPPPAMTPPPALPSNGGSPTIISPESAENSSRNSSVSMYGGQAPVVAPSTYAANGAVPSALGGSALGGSGMPVSFNTSRDLRTDANAKPIDPAVQYLNMAAHAELARQENRPFPPLPPMPGTQEPRQPQGNQPPVPH